MKLDERLRALNKLPEQPFVKQRIQREITNSGKKGVARRRLTGWHEFVLLLGVCLIGCFLLITASKESRHHAVQGDIIAITSYHNISAEGFRGRASTLFIGVQNVADEQTVRFFQNTEQLEQMDNDPLPASESFDLVVVEKGETSRYQLTETYLYDVDNAHFYQADEQSTAIFAGMLQEADKDKPGLLLWIIPFSVLVIQWIIQSYYKYRGIREPKKIPGVGHVLVLGFAVLAYLGIHVFMIGPLYRPLLYGLAVAYGFLNWLPLKRHLTNLYSIKAERLRILLLVLLMFFWISLY